MPVVVEFHDPVPSPLRVDCPVVLPCQVVPVEEEPVVCRVHVLPSFVGVTVPVVVASRVTVTDRGSPAGAGCVAGAVAPSAALVA